MSEVIPPLPLVLPLLMAAVMVGASPILRRARPVRDLLVTLAMGVTTALSALLIWYSRDSTIIYWFGGWTPREGKALGIAFDIEPIGAGLATLAGFLTTAALTYSWHYFEEIRGLYHSLVLTFAAGMIGFSLTGDLFNLFVFFELMGVAAYGLTCYQREAPTLEGALNLAVTNSAGAFLILIGIALLYARTSALNLVEIGVVLAEGVERGPDGLVVIASALLLTGFLVKAAAVPFHFWLPDAHAVAPTPVCSLFSGVMVGLGLYAIAQIYWTALSGILGTGLGVRPILVGIGAVTAVLGAIMCFLQRHLKRLLAFSTISHSGVTLIGIGLFTAEGLSGAVIYLFGHGLIKAALFLTVGIILHRKGSVDELDLFGRGGDLRSAGVLFTIGGLALAGAPPFGLFIGKGMIEDAASTVGYGWTTPLAIFASLVTGGAVLRAGGRIFLGLGRKGGPEEEAPEERPGQEIHGAYGWTPAVMTGPVIGLLAAALGIGVSTAIPEFYQRAAIGFIGNSEPSSVAPSYTISTIISAAVSTLGALLLAWTSAAHDLSQIPGPIGRVIGWSNQGLELLHSGNVTDYIAWLILGAALLGAILALTAG